MPSKFRLRGDTEFQRVASGLAATTLAGLANNHRRTRRELHRNAYSRARTNRINSYFQRPSTALSTIPGTRGRLQGERRADIKVQKDMPRRYPTTTTRIYGPNSSLRRGGARNSRSTSRRKRSRRPGSVGRRRFSGSVGGRRKGRKYKSRTRGRGRGGRTGTKTKSKKKKVGLKRKRKAIRKLAAPRGFFDKLSQQSNGYVGWDTSQIITSDVLQARVAVKSVAGTSFVPISGLAATAYADYPSTTGGTNISVGYGNSLNPYVIAATNSGIKNPQIWVPTVVNDAGARSLPPTGIPVSTAFIGPFASALQGTSTVVTSEDISRQAYMQIKSYTDKYILTNAGNTPCRIRVWHVKKKTTYLVVNGTIVGAGDDTVAYTGNYLEGTGEFECALEWAAVSEEYSDDSVYNAIAAATPGYVTNTAPSASGATTNFGSVSGSLNLYHSMVWDHPMNKWKSLKKFWDIKKNKEFVIPIGGSITLTYHYKIKVYSINKLVTDYLISTSASTNDRGACAKHLEIYFQCIGDKAISNDDNYQLDWGRASCAIRNERTIVHRIVTAGVPGMKFRTNSVYSENLQGFNRHWGSQPEVVVSNPMVIGPQLTVVPGHVPVDVFMTDNAVPAVGWIPIKGAPTAGTSLYVTSV